MRILVCIAVLALGSAQAAAQEMRVEIIDYGIYSGRTVGHTDRPGTANGINEVLDRKLIEQTEVVTARLGERFGIEYVVRGQPNGTIVTLTEITRFPPQGLVNAKGERLQKSEFEWQEVIGRRAIRTYDFTDAWEMVEGDWTLEFYYQGRKIGEKRFKIVLP